MHIWGILNDKRKVQFMEFLLSGILAVTWRQAVMYVIGGVLIWLAVKK